MPAFLTQLGAIAAVTGAVIVPAAEGGSKDTEKSLGVQITAAIAEAAVFATTARVNPYEVVGYLRSTLAVVEILELLNGFDPPKNGSEFRDGATTFSHDISAILTGAAPTDWFSAAAEKYDQANKEQQDRAKQFPQADQRIAEIVATQAQQVEQGREGLAATRLALVGAIPTFVALCTLWAIFAYDKTNITAWSIAEGIAYAADKLGNFLAFITAVTALGLISSLIDEGRFNAAYLDEPTRMYKQIVSDVAAKIPSSMTAVEMPTALPCADASSPMLPASRLTPQARRTRSRGPLRPAVCRGLRHRPRRPIRDHDSHNSGDHRHNNWFPRPIKKAVRRRVPPRKTPGSPTPPRPPPPHRIPATRRRPKALPIRPRPQPGTARSLTHCPARCFSNAIR